ncbi:MAG TPA: HAMP domain-containing sensor histidine kinase [Acidimicrobiales bacterium]|nr:HAMP domain-containing sensor histidine kinase [Acidimicrobiales bacterium]
MSVPATPPPSAAYRSAAPPSPPSDTARRFLFGAALVIAAGAVVAGFAGRGEVEPGRAAHMGTALDTISALCGAGVFVLTRATWRQIGDRAALWVGAGALLFAVAAGSRVGSVVLIGSSPSNRWLVAGGAAGTALTPLLLAAGLLPSLLRRPLAPAAVTAVAVTALIAAAVLMRTRPGLESAFTVTQLTRAASAPAVAAGLAVAAAWLALAVAYCLRGFAQRRLYGWAGLMLFALTVSGLIAGAARGPDGRAVGAAGLGALGALVAVAGSYLDLTRAYEDQTLELSDSEIEADAAEARLRVRVADLRAQRHDLINAITAIDGAASTLEREFNRLSERDRQTLARVLGSGTARLRTLLSQDKGFDGQVSLAEAAARVAEDPAWHRRLDVHVDAGLVAAGSQGETAEVVRQLVEYAHRRGPDTRVTVRGERDGEWVVLRVEDRGPTLSRDVRRRLLHPDNGRGPEADSDRGLRVAARLMRAQGGDVWVEPRPGGGSSFGICLPALTEVDGETGAAS